MTSDTVLPSDVQYCHIIWQAYEVIADSTDIDTYPDKKYPTGTVTFIPKIADSILFNGTNPPFTLLPRPIVATLAEENLGKLDLYLVSTDNADGNPIFWDWAVSFQLNDGIKHSSFAFQAPAGQTVDLSTVTPIDTSTEGEPIIQGPKGDAATISVGTTTTTAPGTDADITNSGTTKDAVFDFDIPRGDVGPPPVLDADIPDELPPGAVPTFTLTLIDAATGTYSVHAGIPQGFKGDTGDTGPANVLTIGVVSTGAPGSQAIATVTGASPDQILNLTVPRGDTGAKGDKGDTGVSGITFQGPWDSSKTYAYRDTVTWGGSAYFALETPPAVGVPPTGTSTDPGVDDTALNTGWELFALQGAKGDIGDTPTLVSDAPDNLAPTSNPTATITPVTGQPGTFLVHFGIPQGVPGTGNVNTVNGQGPDGSGNVVWLPTAADITDSTAIGQSLIKQATATAIRTLIGAGTSSFSGAYSDLTGKPTLGTAAAEDVTAFDAAGTAAQYASSYSRSFLFGGM